RRSGQQIVQRTARSSRLERACCPRAAHTGGRAEDLAQPMLLDEGSEADEDPCHDPLLLSPSRAHPQLPVDDLVLLAVSGKLLQLFVAEERARHSRLCLMQRVSPYGRGADVRG